MEVKKYIEISVNDGKAIGDYLSTKPWADVNRFMVALQKGYKEDKIEKEKAIGDKSCQDLKSQSTT